MESLQAKESESIKKKIKAENNPMYPRRRSTILENIEYTGASGSLVMIL